MAKFDVLDFLCPDRGESTEYAGSGGAAEQRTAGFEQRAPGWTFVRAAAIRNSL